MPVVKMGSGAQIQAKQRGGGPIWLSSPIYIFVSFISGVGREKET